MHAFGAFEDIHLHPSPVSLQPDPAGIHPRLWHQGWRRKGLFALSRCPNFGAQKGTGLELFKSLSRPGACSASATVLAAAALTKSDSSAASGSQSLYQPIPFQSSRHRVVIFFLMGSINIFEKTVFQ